MYTQEQYEQALSLYGKCGLSTKRMAQLGYPARRHIS